MPDPEHRELVRDVVAATSYLFSEGMKGDLAEYLNELPDADCDRIIELLKIRVERRANKVD